MFFSTLRRRRTLVAAIIASIPLAILAFQAGLRIQGNFHVVVPGQYYRAAQLSPAGLDDRIKQYGIRTVVNLRGAQPESAWYRDERGVAVANNVQLIDFPMSSSKTLSDERAKKLVALLKAAPKPILVHCHTGADRTGLVSVIYASQVAGIDEETSEEQLSPIYGHFGIPLLSPTYAMDSSWEALEKTFGIEGS